MAPRTAAALTKCQRPLYDFLASTSRSFHTSSSALTTFDTVPAKPAFHTQPTPSNNASEYPPHSQPSRVPRSGLAAAKSPAPLSKPLTEAQREFLESAVRSTNSFSLSIYLYATLSFCSDLPNAFPAQSKPSRRTSRHPNLQSPNSSRGALTPPPSPPHETYVRPRSVPLQHLQRAPRQAPHPPHRLHTTLAPRCHRSGLVYRAFGARGGDGLYRGGGDGDRRAL